MIEWKELKKNRMVGVLEIVVSLRSSQTLKFGKNITIS